MRIPWGDVQNEPSGRPPHLARNARFPGGFELPVSVALLRGKLLERPISLSRRQHQIAGLVPFPFRKRVRKERLLFAQRVVIVLTTLAAKLDRQKKAAFTSL